MLDLLMDSLAITIDDIAIVFLVGPVDADEQTRLGLFFRDPIPLFKEFK